ncbi:MAG: hypothetical protein KBD78_15830 [Oligoflexales bacterium]|nr:hypothetical protein [Oligoflexales bacterium]
MEQTKAWYTSKTILVNILIGVSMIIGSFSPSVAEFIKTYFAEASGAWTVINIVLRAITKDKIFIA